MPPISNRPAAPRSEGTGRSPQARRPSPSVLAAHRVEFAGLRYVPDFHKKSPMATRRRPFTLFRQIKAVFVLTVAGHTLDHLMIASAARQIR